MGPGSLGISILRSSASEQCQAVKISFSRPSHEWAYEQSGNALQDATSPALIGQHYAEQARPANQRNASSGAEALVVTQRK